MGKRISEQCKTYELYARRNRSKAPFPIEVREMLLYIRYRGLSSVFCKHLTNLEVHPLHGPTWFKTMTNNPEVRKAMRYYVKKWKPSLASHTTPCLGIDYNADPSFYDATESDMEEFGQSKPKVTTTTVKKLKKKKPVAPLTPVVVPQPQYTNVFSVVGPHRKVGFIARSNPTAEQLANREVNERAIHEATYSTPTTSAPSSNTTPVPSSPSQSDSSLAQVVPDHPLPPPRKNPLPPLPPPSPPTTPQTIYHIRSESPEEIPEVEDDMSPGFIEPYILIERYDKELSDREDQEDVPPPVTNKRERPDENLFPTTTKRKCTKSKKSKTNDDTTKGKKKASKKSKSINLPPAPKKKSQPKRKNAKSIDTLEETTAETSIEPTPPPQKTTVPPPLPLKETQAESSTTKKSSSVLTEASFDYDDGFNFDSDLFLSLESSVMQDKGKGKEKTIEDYDDEYDYGGDDTIFDFNSNDAPISPMPYTTISKDEPSKEEEEAILLSDDEENNRSHLIIPPPIPTQQELDSPIPTATTKKKTSVKDPDTLRRKEGRPRKNSELQRQHELYLQMIKVVEEETKSKTKEDGQKKRAYRKKVMQEARKLGPRKILTIEEQLPMTVSTSYNDIVDDFINNPDSEFTEQVYDAYIERLETMEEEELRTGIKINEPELMVLNHVAIEKYDG